jgi:tetratricopeptide (TPR) repeat protein
VKKQQWFVAGTGIVLVAILFFFGKTVPPKKQQGLEAASASTNHTAAYDIKASLSAAKANLSPARQGYINSLESAVVRGDVKNQQVHIYHQLANFWKDSVRLFEPYAFFTAEASKLENSEKSLTFAAQLFLDNLRAVNEEPQKLWMAQQARELFERALKLNPANDSAKIGLGSTYIFGSAPEDPGHVMQGIQHILEVARRDSTNMYAQLMLGIGGLVSGQYDRAIERLNKVVAAQPSNVEAILTLAEAYERHGDPKNAARWYQESKKHIANQDILTEIDSRIRSLK